MQPDNNSIQKQVQDLQQKQQSLIKNQKKLIEFATATLTLTNNVAAFAAIGIKDTMIRLILIVFFLAGTVMMFSMIKFRNQVLANQK